MCYLPEMPILAALLVLLVISPQSRAGLFGPDNYDECITHSMKGVNSDVAARAIIKSCKQQFPEQTKTATLELSYKQIAKLSGEAAPIGDGTRSPLTNNYLYKKKFAGYIYNGNPDINVTEITISLVPKNIENAEERLYRLSLSLNPLSRSDFAFQHVFFDNATKYSWKIVSAKGFVSK